MQYTLWLGCMSDTAEVEELVPRCGSSSVIWKYFGFRASDLNQHQTIFKVCCRAVSAPQGNTTNSFGHLNTHHKIDWRMHECYESVASANAITFHLAKDMCPINTVSNEVFKKMVNILDNRYVIPSRNYFSKVASPALYSKRQGECLFYWCILWWHIYFSNPIYLNALFASWTNLLQFKHCQICALLI